MISWVYPCISEWFIDWIDEQSEEHWSDRAKSLIAEIADLAKGVRAEICTNSRDDDGDGDVDCADSDCTGHAACP